MLINCPKCGFEQPKDQFCANCGVNLERYEGQKKPLFDQLLCNSSFYLISLLLISFALGVYLLRNWDIGSGKQLFTPNDFREELEQEIESLETEISHQGLQKTTMATALKTEEKTPAMRLSFALYLAHFTQEEVESVIKYYPDFDSPFEYPYFNLQVSLSCTEILGQSGNLLSTEKIESDRALQKNVVLGQKAPNDFAEFQGFYVDLNASGDMDISYLSLSISFNLLHAGESEESSLENMQFNSSADIEFRNSSCYLVFAKIPEKKLAAESLKNSSLEKVTTITSSPESRQYIAFLIEKIQK